MSRRVIILQTDRAASQALADYFQKHGDQVWNVKDVRQATEILKKNVITLALIDLHQPGNGWLELIRYISQQSRHTRLIVTNIVPDVRREWLAKEQGVKVFLRAPFTPEWIERSVRRAEQTNVGSSPEPAIPKVKVSFRTKITLPYALLALLFTLAGAYMILRFVSDSSRERFTNQLYDSARLSADWMVEEENRLLGTLRLLSHTQGIADALLTGGSNQLRDLALPETLNSKEEAVELLDSAGVSLLSLRHRPEGGVQDYEVTRGDASFQRWEFIQKVLKLQVDQEGDKYAALVNAPWGNYFYIAGPVFNSQNQLVGVVLVGKSLKTLAQQDRDSTLAQISIYAKDGSLLTSTLFMTQKIEALPAATVSEVLALQDQRSFLRNISLKDASIENLPQRNLQVASSQFTELLGPWEARNGEDLGVIGISLTENFQVMPKTGTRVQAVLLIGITFVGVIALGLLLASQVTRQLKQVVTAATQIAKGNLDVRLSPTGNDEVAVVAHAFNYMVSGLQEGSIYRDLLGRTVSPEVREALRHSFEKGDLRLEGQNTVATVLMSDIRGFTALSEKEQPTTILNWLNEYYAELVPIITSYGGVVDKFEGDALLSFFGVLPTPLPPEQSAYQACQAMAEMLRVIDRLNIIRRERGEPALISGISANTGMLTVGGLGRADRLNYTVIGNTVNTTQRMQALTREFGESGAVISESTLTALKGKRGNFRFEPLGEQAFPGKIELLWVYRLWPVDKQDGQTDEQGEASSEHQAV